jgi:hypothetical protein
MPDLEEALTPALSIVETPDEEGLHRGSTTLSDVYFSDLSLGERITLLNEVTGRICQGYGSYAPESRIFLGIKISNWLEWLGIVTVCIGILILAAKLAESAFFSPHGVFITTLFGLLAARLALKSFLFKVDFRIYSYALERIKTLRNEDSKGSEITTSAKVSP